MRIGIPTIEESGLESRVSEHFGRAPCHLLVDLATRKVTVPGRAPGRGVGSGDHCGAVDLMLAHGVGVVACKGLGAGALRRLTEAGVEVFATGAETAGGAVEEYRRSCRWERQPPAACSGHGPDHEH